MGRDLPDWVQQNGMDEAIVVVVSRGNDLASVIDSRCGRGRPREPSDLQ